MTAFLAASKSNIPLARFVRPDIVQHMVEAIVFYGNDLARHEFFDEDDPVKQRPSALAFVDAHQAQSYLDDVINLTTTKMTIKQLVSRTLHVGRGSLGLTIRNNGEDFYFDPTDLSEINMYAGLGGLQPVKEDDALRRILEASPIVDTYSVWRGSGDCSDEVVVEIVMPEGVRPRDAQGEHTRLLDDLHGILDDVTIVALPQLRDNAMSR